MAGAISAGAYTAGVLDVLLEALDIHNARYARAAEADWQGEFAGFPRHKVVLRVMSGTSAGGVSTGLAVAGLIGARKETEGADGTQIQIAGKGDYTSESGYSYSYNYILEPLHHVWVEALDLWREVDGEGDGFLTVADMATGKVRSALNSEHIDRAAEWALSDIRWNGGTYRFLAEDLELFLTTTNLQGVPYEVSFASSGELGDAHSHAMSQHSAVRHFRISGLGTEGHVSDWLEAWGDDGIPLPLNPGRVDFDGLDTNWRHFKAAAVATGAFPVGLAARIIEAEAHDFGPFAIGERTRGGALPIDLCPMGTDEDGSPIDNRPMPRMGEGVTGADGVTYVAVDGGVANNEPFELARYTLRRAMPGPRTPGEKFLTANPRGAKEAHSSVLMIDPFPEGPVFTPLTRELADGLSGIVPTARALFPALINQARFKPGELIEASSKSVHSRYLLAPSRREGTDERERRGDAAPPPRIGFQGAAAIACGSFGGFGGFFDRAFRAHDYMLGQRNCHSFLARHFNLHGENPVLNLAGTGREAEEKVRVIDAGDGYYAERRPLPDWPRIGQAKLEPILTNARTRVGEVGSKLVNLSELPFLLRFALGTIWSINALGVEGVGTRIGKALRSIVMSELIERDQHQDFLEKAPGVRFEPWQRAVLVMLAKAGDQPIALALEDWRRDEMVRRGEAPRELLAAVIEPDDTAEEREAKRRDLRAFLEDPAVSRHLWRAPDRHGESESYTLLTMRPESRWVRYASALGSRVRGWFGG